jgi:hypothetical protein
MPLVIDKAQFMQAFGRDLYHDDESSPLTYLDRKTGDVIWVFQNDEDAELEYGPLVGRDNEAVRRRVAAEPERYLLLPGLEHGEHHQILKDFVNSDWTEDEEERKAAKHHYFPSIGGWKNSVDGRTWNAFLDVRDRQTTLKAEEFLRQNGIEPDWW